jgi:hypothetical protein
MTLLEILEDDVGRALLISAILFIAVMAFVISGAIFSAVNEAIARDANRRAWRRLNEAAAAADLRRLEMMGEPKIRDHLPGVSKT